MASSIIASLIKQLGTLLVEEAKSLYAVKGKIIDLQKELVLMQCFLQDADNREHKEKLVSQCVADIRDLAYEAEDLIERYIHDVSNPLPKQANSKLKEMLNTLKWFACVCFGDAVALHTIGSSIDERTKNLKKMTSGLKNYGICKAQKPESSTSDSAMWEKRRTFSISHEKTVGLEKHINELVDKLVNGNEFSVVGICGIGGLGKTTLAREVYSDTRVKDRFKNCVWVYLSKQFEKRQVFEEILIGLTCSGKDGDDGARKKIKRLTYNELQGKICEVLENEECLVLLDDIWSKEAWKTLEPVLGSIYGGRSRILITTRDMDLVHHPDPRRCGYRYPFGPLNKEDAWKLLQQASYLEMNNLHEAAEVKAKKEEFGKEMLNHCEGLPLAIVALGGILTGKSTIHEWEIVAKNISAYFCGIVQQEDGGTGIISHVLELSFYDLPYYLKPCFMYLGMFPEDYEISADRLYHLWEAEGLITVSNDDKTEIDGVTLHDTAESYLKHLVNKSMVQVDKMWPNGRIESCRLHDVMRYMCLKKCREVNFLEIVERKNLEEVSNCNTPSCSATNRRNSRRRAIYMKDEEINVGRPIFDAVDLDEAPYIRSLLVHPYNGDDDGPKQVISQDMMRALSLLRVLDFEGLQMSGGASMLRYCIHLRYLRIVGMQSMVEEQHVVDYIWNCKYLETLKLQVRKLVLSNEFCKLGRLRHLYLPSDLSLVGGSKLSLTDIQLRQIETLENINLKYFQMEDMRKMTNLRSLSFSLDVIFRNKDDLWHLIESPAIKKGCLTSPLYLRVHTDALKEEPTLLTSTSLKLICIHKLDIWGRIEEVASSGELGENSAGEASTGYGGVRIFPHTVRELQLRGCELGKEGILELEELPDLEYLELSGKKCITGSKMSFSAGGFKQLLRLSLFDVSELEEWEVGEGSLPNLRFLNAVGCGNLKRIPEGLPPSIKIVCREPFYIDGCYNYNGFEEDSWADDE